MSQPARQLEPVPAPPAVDQAGFETIYRAELRSVWRFLHRLGVRGAALDDLTHDVFLTAWRKLSTYDARKPPAPWLKGIAWRVAVDQRRLHSHHQEQLSDSAGVDAIHPDRAPDEQLSGRETQGLLDDALAQLDVTKRTVLVLHDLEGHTIPEIAELMESPVPTAYSRLRLARAELRSTVQRLRVTRGIA